MLVVESGSLVSRVSDVLDDFVGENVGFAEDGGVLFVFVVCVIESSDYWVVSLFPCPSFSCSFNGFNEYPSWKTYLCRLPVLSPRLGGWFASDTK